MGDANRCAICFDPVDLSPDAASSLSARSLVKMPCCYKDSSSIIYCRSCIETICKQDNGIGTCPTCGKFYTINAAGEFKSSADVGICNICRQKRVLVEGSLCEACSIGRRLFFFYECEHCHRRQRIPHPMWTYQARPDAYTTETWSCHSFICGSRQRHWRITPQGAMSLPAANWPAAWGSQEEWMAQANREIPAQHVGSFVQEVVRFAVPVVLLAMAYEWLSN